VISLSVHRTKEEGDKDLKTALNKRVVGLLDVSLKGE
jgi:hypothetical protein